MSQQNKSLYYQALKKAGVNLERPYRDYTETELRDAYTALQAGAPPGTVEEVVPVKTEDVVPPHDADDADVREQIAGLTVMMGKLAQVVGQIAEQAAKPPVAVAAPPQPEPPKQAPRLSDFDPTEHAGVTMNTQGPDEPIRIDPDGTKWFRNEVQKPGFPKPRGRRILREMDPGTVTETISVPGGYTETFEIPGDPTKAKPIEVRVTLPSYQTGIYQPPGMPFRIHIYQGVRGFDFDDVNRFYGGSDLVPASVKRCYVSSDLCYDITTTIRAIEDEYRERVLRKEPVR